MRRTFHGTSLMLLTFAFAALNGCRAGETETGYQPHHLAMNGSQIRGLYAPAFSPEAQNAKNEQNQILHNMPHAGPGTGGL